MGIALTLLPLATLRLEFIIPISASGQAARARVRTAFACLASTVAICFGAGFFLHWWNSGHVSEQITVTSVLLLAYGVTAVENSILIRHSLRQRLAARNAVAGVSAALAQVLIAFVHPSIILLAIAVLFGRVFALLTVRRPSASGNFSDDPRNSTSPEDDYGVRRAIPVVLAGMLSAGTLNGLTVLSSIGFSHGVAGQVGIAQRIAGAPLSLTGQALSQLSQTRTSGFIRAERLLWKPVVRQMRLLALCGVALSITLAVGGLLLAEPILGPGWDMAGKIVAIMAIPAALQIVVSPSDYLLIVLGRQWWLLTFQVVRLLLSVGAALLALWLSGDVYVVTLAYSLGWAGAYLMSIAGILIAVKRYDTRIGCSDTEVSSV
ncbi:hypothetical protein [Rhodococcus pyridinivorans]|uniref:hypothetical protein n=1 Tax=Rhodococcus pyridinivorans TaxID=103816 RepID=UPI001365F840|nr:hypothetical protein [Rhodococcus pyridinivorans]